MVFKSKQTTVAFLPPQDKGWMGGVNYYCNLFTALTSNPSKAFSFCAFVGKKTHVDLVNMYELCGVKVIKSSILDRFSFLWFIDRISWGLFGKRLCLNKLFKNNSIALISHIQSDMGVDCNQVGWIPDFQHLHLPDMFSRKEIRNRNKSFMSVASKGDVVILSSYDALSDFNKFSPEFAFKGYVAQFVSQPPTFYSDLNEIDRDKLFDKYSIDRPYVYVPNQFWRHKNHQLLLDALLKCKNRGENPFILCSGLMEDYRDKTYVDSLLKYALDNDLTDNVKFLGLIPYKDVFSLIKFSILVLNPSKFEGWSSTVEECKSTGKVMLLSDIAVHKEQYSNALFFETNSSESLANRLSDVFLGNIAEKPISVTCLQSRTQGYSSRYIDLYESVLHTKYVE